MYLKLLISFGFTLFCNFTVTFKNHNILLQTYKQVFFNSDLTINDSDFGMCEAATLNLIWKATMCQRIFQLLRSNSALENPFRDSLYMNYTALITPENFVCEMKRLIDLNPNILQIAMNCYGRLAVDPVSHDNNWHFNEISIMYGLNYSIMVFRQLPNTNNYYTLFEWYQFTEWYLDREVPDYIFTAPVPQVISMKLWFEEVFSMSPENISRMSMNSENFLNTSESAANIQKYCSVLCRDYPQVTNREAILEDLLQQDERENIKLTLKKSLLLPMANEINIKNSKYPMYKLIIANYFR